MRIGRLQLGVIDVVGAAVAVVITCGGYILLIRGPISEIRELSEVRDACDRMTQNISTMRGETDRLQRDTEAMKKQLVSVGGGLPKVQDLDRYLAQVMASAVTNGIKIDSVTPLPIREQTDHREIYVSFAGRGPYEAFHRMLRTIEQELEYGDITNFSVAMGEPGNQSMCRLGWSLRICADNEGKGIKVVSRAESR